MLSAPPGSMPAATRAVRSQRASRWWRRFFWTPSRIVLLYATASVAWIASSDRLLHSLVSDAAEEAHLQTLKGAVFVALTSALLFMLMRRGSTGQLARDAEVRATVDSMADAVLLMDGRERIVEANRAALELFGVAKEALLVPLEDWGRRFALRYADGTPVPYERYATVRASHGERVAAYDAIVRRADGRDTFVSITAAPVEGSTPGLAVAVLRDVSPARRLAETRDEFLSTAAHELKTPLAVIKAYAQMVQRRQPSEAPALTVVQRQVDRLDRMVQDLLDASRVRLDDADVARERVDVAALAAELVSRIQPAAPRHPLSLDAPDGPATVMADRERIGRVLKNLLDNAIRFSPAGGAVDVRVSARPEEVEVAVRDHGLGIPAERQDRVFERFYRAHAGTPQDYGGLGLGLEMSREIVARHGGRIWFESAYGHGSTFHFTLPRQGAPA